MSTLICPACKGRLGSTFSVARMIVPRSAKGNAWLPPTTGERECWRCDGTGAITDATPPPEEHDA